VADYRLEEIGADALGLIEAAGAERAHVVGHDWGGAVAWWLAAHEPERVDRLVVLNCPHPAVMRRAVTRNPRQMLRSWYIGFFQLPWLPEWVAGLGGHRLLVNGLHDSSRPGTFDEETMSAYREEWARPGALRAMIHWYRAMHRPPVFPAGDIRPPTLLIWGCRDRALGRELAAPSIACCADGRLVEIEAATHWVQHEEAPRVVALIDEHLRCMRPVDPN
jgi:pimeloyl-ACP methyl ester carboxylesterase